MSLAARVRNRLTLLGNLHLAKSIVRSRLSKPIVTFTFDDFPKSAWRVGGQILGDHGARGSYFPVKRFFETTIDGIEYFDRDDVGELLDAGHELGCHTANHHRMPDLAADEIEAELSDNAEFLDDVAPGRTISSFAYPYGATSPRVKQAVGKNFTVRRSVHPGVNSGDVDLGFILTVCLEDIILSKRSVDEWIAQARDENGWLVFLTHDVQDDPTPYGISPKAFEETVAKVAAAGIDILPMNEAVEQLSGH